MVMQRTFRTIWRSTTAQRFGAFGNEELAVSIERHWGISRTVRATSLNSKSDRAVDSSSVNSHHVAKTKTVFSLRSNCIDDHNKLRWFRWREWWWARMWRSFGIIDVRRWACWERREWIRGHVFWNSTNNRRWCRSAGRNCYAGTNWNLIDFGSNEAGRRSFQNVLTEQPGPTHNANRMIHSPLSAFIDW